MKAVNAEGKVITCIDHRGLLADERMACAVQRNVALVVARLGDAVRGVAAIERDA